MADPDLIISAGFSDAQLVKEANKIVAMYAKKGEEAQKAFQDAQGRVTDTQALKAHMRELDKLSKAYDPAYRTAKQYESEVKRLDRALDVGAITQAQYAAKVADAARQMKAAGAATQQVTKGFSRQTTMQIQNAAFQIGDFAVQVASGTSASRALGQQMPQLLGGFGALGAVMGAVVAIAVPLVSSLMGVGDAAKNYEDALKGLRDAQSRLNDSIALANMPLGELFDTYGAAAGKVREMAEAQLRLNIAIARGEISKSIGGIREVTAEYTRLGVGFSTYAQAMDAIERDFGLTGDAAEELRRKLRSLNEATTNEARLTQFQELASWLEAAGVPLERMPPEFARAAANMLDLNINAEQLRELVNDATRAAEGTANAVNMIDFSNAISGADALAGRLSGIIGQARTALSVLGQAMQRNIDASSRNELLQAEQRLLEAGKGRVEIEGELAAIRQRQQIDSAGVFLPVAARQKVIDDARAEAEAAQTAIDAISRLNAERAKAERDASGGGGGSKRKGGGGGKAKEPVNIFESADREIQQLERQIELVGKSTQEAATLQARWEMLDEAKKRGIPINEQLNAQIDAQASRVGELTAELEQAEIAQQQFDQAIDGIADAFAGALVAGESLRDGLAQVFKQIASDILSSGIKKALVGQFGAGGTSVIGGILGSIFGGFRASGGPVSSGKSYVVGENGPELFTPNVNGAILNAQQVSAAAGGGGVMNINVNVAGASGDQHIVSLVQQGVSLGLQSYDRSLPDRIRQVNSQPRWS